MPDIVESFATSGVKSEEQELQGSIVMKCKKKPLISNAKEFSEMKCSLYTAKWYTLCITQSPKRNERDRNSRNGKGERNNVSPFVFQIETSSVVGGVNNQHSASARPNNGTTSSHHHLCRHHYMLSSTCSPEQNRYRVYDTRPGEKTHQNCQQFHTYIVIIISEKGSVGVRSRGSSQWGGGQNIWSRNGFGLAMFFPLNNEHTDSFGLSNLFKFMFSLRYWMVFMTVNGLAHFHWKWIHQDEIAGGIKGKAVRTINHEYFCNYCKPPLPRFAATEEKNQHLW